MKKTIAVFNFPKYVYSSRDLGEPPPTATHVFFPGYPRIRIEAFYEYVDKLVQWPIFPAARKASFRLIRYARGPNDWKRGKNRQSVERARAPRDLAGKRTYGIVL